MFHFIELVEKTQDFISQQLFKTAADNLQTISVALGKDATYDVSPTQ